MANPGVGNKFVSVNLNKSYGQPNHHSHNSFGATRGRGGSGGSGPGSGGGGGGGGMVVLSRPRSSQKSGTKLSVPPPLNLPSLRKEHEKFDSLGSGGGTASGGVSGGGARPSSSGMGWTKPGAASVALPEKDVSAGDHGGGEVNEPVKGIGGGVYMPPSARSVAVVGGSAPATVAFPPLEKAPVLRGEDFPSLKAALPSATAGSQKQKDGSSQKQKQVVGVGEEPFYDQRNGSSSSSSYTPHSVGPVDMRPQLQSSRDNTSNGFRENDTKFIVGGTRATEQVRKPEEYFAGPLPIVRLNPRSDWADDERDTSYGLTDRGGRDFPKNEAYWDRDFDVRRASAMPHKPVQNGPERWGVQRDDEVGGKVATSSEVPKRDPHSREGREGNSWKSSTLPKDGSGPFREGGKQPWHNNNAVSGYRDGTLQKSSAFKSPYSSNGRGMPVNDPILNFGRDKRHFSKAEKPYVEDPFMRDFGATDPLSGGLLGVVKRKKDVPKQTDFHDPVRESFEAELERVQKMQEQERRREVEEQERAMEVARREEEERARLVREQEDRQRIMFEEAREVARRAEQEQLEAMRRVEEQRVAREEEKRRIFLEEERRKQAAKQKLLELEEKMAKRHSEPTHSEALTDDQLSLGVKEKDASRALEAADWEEGERMVERITTSASSDSSSFNRPSDMASRSQFSRESSTFPDNRGKSFNSWRRDGYDNGNSSALQYQDQDYGHHSPRRDVSVGGRTYSRKEFYGGTGLMPPRTYHRGVSEPLMDDFGHLKGQRWNLSGDGDPYNRNQDIDPEINDQLVEKFGDVGWGQPGGSRGNLYSQYPERLYPNSEADVPYSYGRSRYSVRQPRVLPPPAITSMHKSSYRSEVERPGPSTYLDSEIQYSHPPRNEPTTQTIYDGARDENLGQPVINAQQENEQKLGDGKATPRCDSQSSLSVSSPPSSPTHLSHEDLDESGESSELSNGGDSKDVSVSGQESEVAGLPSNADKENTATDASSASAAEEEEWGVDNNEQLQEQEEYDEDEDGYEEEDEVHEVDDDLLLGFGGMNLEEKEESENTILGFNEGVEVGMPTDDNDECSAAAPPDNVDGTLQPLEGSSHSSNLATNSSGPAVISSAPAAVPSEAEVPIKLQFGLFSGPSLIPSPVPAIQIGSIQMPLHLHPQVGTSLSHMHSSQPLFQFGQLRYASPMSQGMMPFPHQPMPYMQPGVPSSFPFSQTPVGPLPTQPIQDSSQPFPKNNVTILLADNKVGAVSRNSGASHENRRQDISLLTREKTETPVIVQRGRSELSYSTDNKRSASEGHALSSAQGGQSQSGAGLSHLVGPKVQGSSGRGKRFAFAVKNSGSRPYPPPDSSYPESSGYQRRPRRNISRTEFRVRESADRRQYSAGLVSSDGLGLDEKPNASVRGSGFPARPGGPRRVVSSHNASKQTLQSEVSNSVPRETDAVGKTENGSGKESSANVHGVSQSGEGKNKRNICEEDVDAPLQSGVVRVFAQPGIEAPSDEDDFIEVRSKRQMLNDRREQREKEIKAKSRVLKVPRKSRSSTKVISSANSGKVFASSGGAATSIRTPDYVSSEGRGLAAAELSTRFNTSTTVSQPLAPIGTPSVKSDSHAIRSVRTSSNAVVSGSVKNPGPGSTYDNKTKVLDDVQPSLSSWDNSRVNQQVMTLTQTQLEEAMKPGTFDSHASSAGKHSASVNESNMSSSSIITKDKSFSSSASPVNSLLAGEKIQFGAVTSPTVLPPSSRVVSHGIGPRGPSRPEVQLSHNLGGPDNDCNLLFDKEKHTSKSHAHLEDCEAEAEAAASAVAVAAISSDEVVGNNGLGTCSVSVSGTKSFGGTAIADGNDDHRFASHQSRAEESLTVSLPADLSVETPPMSLWPPPLRSPPNTSNQMLSHFPGGPPSHFPFYEMNPMMGGTVFAFGPHDETASAAQPQKSPAALGPWQQCHSGVDSFYGPPAGFTGPFISPPGVQGPPHMVVYNHFAPVGQFGQVGLSFMGTAYIPSGKQPDWKHNPPSAPMVVGGGSEAEMNNLNVVPGQRNPATIPAPIQHLAPGSPLLPMPSPMAMFDVSPFQSSPDMSGQGRWSHVSAPVPFPMPLQQQIDSIPTNLSRAPADQSINPNRFPESRNPTPSDKYPATTNPSVTRLPNELGLGGPSSSTANSLAVTLKPETVKSDTAQNSVSVQTKSSGIKTQTSQHKANVSSQQHHHGPSSGYGYHRGGSSASHRNNSAGDWNHRRPGYNSSKMKQIYVAKQTNSAAGPPTSTL